MMGEHHAQKERRAVIEHIPMDRALPVSTSFSIACHVSGYLRDSS